MNGDDSLSEPILQAVGRYFRTIGLAGGGLLLACSGGADSTALLRACEALRSPLRLNLTVAHLNHALRGTQADADADWLQQLCARHEIAFVSQTLDVPQRAAQTKISFEEAARDARYEFLERIARTLGLRHVAVGHTADDQVETVLHNLLRGGGLAGLRGIPRERPLAPGIQIIRPLLESTRTEILEFLGRLGQDHRRDATNETRDATRNRLRLDLLPSLRSEFNPRLDRLLLQLARQADEVQQAVAFAAEQLADTLREPSSGTGWAFRWQPLQIHPRHLCREMFVAIWRRQGWPRQEMAFRHWDRLAALVSSGGRECFPGRVEAIRKGRLFLLTRVEDSGTGCPPQAPVPP